jgi:hypothetical protein
MEYKQCKNCNGSLCPRKHIEITTLKGFRVILNSESYCSKNCFMSCIFTKGIDFDTEPFYIPKSTESLDYINLINNK